MELNIEQKHALVREGVTALAALVASFNVLGDAVLSHFVALLTGLIMWGIAYRYGVSTWASFARKCIHAVSPILVYYGVFDLTQGTALSMFLLFWVGMWTKKEKAW